MTPDLDELAEKAITVPSSDWLESVDVLVDALLERGLLEPTAEPTTPFAEVFHGVLSTRDLSDINSMRVRAYEWATRQRDITEISLHTGAPFVGGDPFIATSPDDTLINEVEYDGYERQRFPSSELWNHAEAGAMHTRQRVTFPPVLGTRQFVVTHFGIRRNGMVLGGWLLTAPVQVGDGICVSFAPGALRIDMSRD